ncbi:MAG: hypothetical protein ACK4VI_08320 [Alphaproteobacteria bacterium]
MSGYSQQPDVAAQVQPSDQDASNTAFILSATRRPNDRITYIERPDDTLFISELVLGNDVVLDRGILIYLDDDNTILVPLSVMLGRLQFQIEVDNANGLAKGWFIEEGNSFLLEYPYEKVNIRGKDQAISGIVENHIDDIYVSIDEFSRWFPLTLRFNFNELRLYVETKEQLPFEATAERQSRWQRLQTQRRPQQDIKTELENAVFLPYKMLSYPSIQVTSSGNYSRSGSGGGDSFNYSSTVQAYNDVLGHAATFNATINNTGSGGSSSGNSQTPKLSNVLINFSKQDFRSELLGPLRASKYEFGDITNYSFPLAGGSDRGRGISVTNAPPNYVRDPNRLVIEGFGTQGWDVEIYQDERLLDFQKVDLEGRYRFEDIQLRQGFNLFRVILYGPNGEREERLERFYLGGGNAAPGTFVYEMSVLESSTPLINLENRADTGKTLTLLGEYGINNSVSLYGGVYSGTLAQQSINAVGTGVNVSLGPTYSQLKLLREQDGGQSYGYNFTGNLTSNITVFGGHERHDGYAPNVRSTVRDTFLGFARSFSLSTALLGSYGLQYKTSTLESGVRRDGWINRVSASFRGLNISNELDYSRTSNTDIRDLNGNFTLAQGLPFGIFRSRLNYDLRPERILRSGEWQFQREINKETAFTLGMNKSFVGDRVTTYRGSVDRIFERFRLGVNTEYNSLNDLRLGLKFTFNLVPTSESGGYKMTSSGSYLSAGQVKMIAFIDANGNDEFDEGEVIVPGVAFRNMQRGMRSESNENGVALVEGLSANSLNRITLDSRSLPDIYMMPTKESVSIFGKTGTSGPIYFPITLLGEISGTVETAFGDPIDGLEMMLLNKDEQVVATVYSEYDGFFSFQSLPMGAYRLYFPKSPALSAHHSGGGAGPVFTLSVNNKEILDQSIIVRDSSIQLESDTQNDVVSDNTVLDGYVME